MLAKRGKRGEMSNAILLGGDLNAYSVARSFYIRFGTKSFVLSKYKCGLTSYSSFTMPIICPNLDRADAMLKAIADIAKDSKKEYILIPCADWYVCTALEIKDFLPKNVKYILPNKAHFDLASDKTKFYNLLKSVGVSYPKTLAFSHFGNDEQILASDMRPPYVLKSSESIDYWKLKIKGIKKVYFLDTLKDVSRVADAIFCAGYKHPLLLQERIGDGFDNLMTLTTISDKRGRVVRAVLGDVVAEERGAKAVGNHAGIITKPLNDTAYHLIDLLNKIGYIGIANFDIVTSGTKDYVLDFNPRQGRSCDYLYGAGVSLAGVIYDMIQNGSVPMDFTHRKIFWHSLSKSDCLYFLNDKTKASLIACLSVCGREYTPFDCFGESFIRKLYTGVHLVRTSGAQLSGANNAK